MEFGDVVHQGAMAAACIAKRSLNVLRGRDIWQRAQIRRTAVSLGNAGARWRFCPEDLHPGSVVYSFGVGEDISFDLELIRNYGTQVHAFDPTPRSIDWIRSQILPQRFIFHEYGVADCDGMRAFSAPMNPAHISHTLVERQSPWPAFEVPVRRLMTIARLLGHERIDLLKMDIEGAEYGVIADLIASNMDVRQLLIEFHHRWPEIGCSKTKTALRDLNAAGYQIFSVSSSGEEYGLIRAVGA